MAARGRREFLKLGLAAGAAWALAPAWRALAAAGETAGDEGGGPDVWVIHGEDKQALIGKALAVIFAHGGLGTQPRTLTLKVNAAWARTPEEGACTHPALVEGFLRGCRDAGVRQTVIAENPCTDARFAFPRSGIQEAAARVGTPMINLREGGHWVEREIPGGRVLRRARVGRQFLECDALVNMPVAKHHDATTLTMAMKNWMGAVEDRGFWHRNDLHQCIADFSTFIKPRWTIIDATRIMLTGGPQGPSKDMRHPNLLVVSRDGVAADAFACTLFHDSIDAVRHLVLAREMGIGETDLAKMKLHQLEA